ncbi:Zinc/iron permease [Roridomyces roridus]|uniref:Zinc/iron permease n=1 Tax=Roridomyces roridus TaxID=1738132 RepID=A0AAD7FWZ2_9AGAR|nr:Zinc/iron permease [Roridomyces roridus]
MLGLIVMSALLGASSFGAGLIPLSFVLSKDHVARFSTLGSGVLVGTALSIILPEGIEALADAHPSEKLPTSQIGLSLIVGFVLMLCVEQLLAPHAHSHGAHSDLPLHSVGSQPRHTVEFDADMGDSEQADTPSSGGGFIQVDLASSPDEIKGSRAKAYPLTFGLIIHGLADGLALGVSSLSDSHDLSFIIFLALIIHKAPTSLALSTSLLNTSLPRPECRQHLAFFAASTPFGAIVSYLLLSFFSAGGEGGWTGIVLLVSGGTFLYVATVLQPVSHGPDETMKPHLRVALIAFGMLLPYFLSQFLPEGH